LNIDIEEDFGV